MECSLQISIVQILFVLLVSETFFFLLIWLKVHFTTDCLKWSTLVVETFGLGHGHGLDYLYTDNDHTYQSTFNHFYICVHKGRPSLQCSMLQVFSYVFYPVSRLEDIFLVYIKFWFILSYAKLFVASNNGHDNIKGWHETIKSHWVTFIE